MSPVSLLIPSNIESGMFEVWVKKEKKKRKEKEEEEEALDFIY